MYLPAMPIIGGAQFSVGASAPIFGLLGALVHYGRRTGNSHAGQAGLQYALFLGIFGFIFPGVDNWAHAGGFAGGFLASLILDPSKRERVDHLVLALVCLGLTVVALVASFVTALPYLMQ
jgi:rhomboid protease GluP